MQRAAARLFLRPPALSAAALAAADLCAPAAAFPLARRVPRRLVLHVGPTNSGKTHAALGALVGAARGLYLSPLRLLAFEVYEAMVAAGKPAALVTGQEVAAWAPPARAARAGDVRRGGLVTAATIECAPLDDAGLDVVVIDEIQNIGDAARGWAWTRALLGAPAAEVHACGDAAAVPLVARLAALCGDALEVVEYARLAPLAVAPAPLASWAELADGDAVVAFSRRALFDVKRDIESTTGRRCAIVFGALPPAVRRDQATKFNGAPAVAGAPAAPPAASVLVASDAIGQGLNLRVRRVIFTALSKFDGSRRRPLSVAETKQIAGRAGRFGLGAGEGGGLVAATDARAHAALRAALAAPTPPLRRAGLAPAHEQLEAFAAALAPALGLAGAPAAGDGGDGGAGGGATAAAASRVARALSFSAVLRLFASAARTDARAFFLCDAEETASVAALLDGGGGIDGGGGDGGGDSGGASALSFRARHIFSLAPVHLDDALHVAALRRYGRHFAERGRVGIGLRAPPPGAPPPATPAQLATLESVCRVFDLYLWLARQFSVEFPHAAEAAARAAATQAAIVAGIEALGARNAAVGEAAAAARARRAARPPPPPRAARDEDLLARLAGGDEDARDAAGAEPWWRADDAAPPRAARVRPRRAKRARAGRSRTTFQTC